MISKFFTWIKSIRNNLRYSREKSKFKNSTTPWVVIRGESVDPEKGLKLELDWNEAFIKHLRAQGVRGTKDEDVVSYWLTMINQQMMDSTELSDE